MISGKGILYTVLAATSAAVVVGSVLTGGKRREPLRRLGNKVQNIVGTIKGQLPGQSVKSDVDQLGPAGHS